MEYCISDHYRPTIYQHFHGNGFSFRGRDTGASVRGAQPVDVGSVAAVGDWPDHWWWAESGAGRHDGRRLASVRAEIHFNITSQREVP